MQRVGLFGPYKNEVANIKNRATVAIVIIVLISALLIFWSSHYSFRQGIEEGVRCMWMEELQITEEELRRME